MTKIKACKGFSMRAVWGRGVQTVADRALSLIVLPYYMLYERGTRIPILEISRTEQEHRIISLVEDWFETKSKEAQYVQVAAAVTFTSVVSTLSWTDITGRHWTAPACWYISIVFALVAVVLGAQQTIVLGILTKKYDLLTLKQRLCAREHGGQGYRPRWGLVFAWQCPLMFLSYALVLFLAGLTSYVVSPVALKVAWIWDSDANILLFYLIGTSAAFIVFVLCTRIVHQTFA